MTSQPVDIDDAGRTGAPSRTSADLRQWLDAIDELGQVRRLEGVHWDVEIGTVSELNYRSPDPAALIFDKIIGYPAGFRVLTGSVSNARRLGLTLSLGDDLDDEGLVASLRGRPSAWQEGARNFPPHQVDTAPVFQNGGSGKDVDLLKFPVPRWHEADGGRYLGTGGVTVTVDHGTGVSNVGAYRAQVQDDGATVTLNMVSGKHGAQHVQGWFRAESRAPVALVFGQDPLFLVLGGTEVPTGVSELAYAGAVLGRPVDVVSAPVTGLPVPASAEILLEGWLRPGDVRHEGPFGEWTGYYSGSDDPVLAVEVAGLYWRDDPIILGSPPGRPPHDYSYMRTVMKSAMIHDALVATGLPGVKGVWAHEAGGGRLLLAVAISQAYCGHSRQAGYLAAQCQPAAYMNRYVIVVDDDIDPCNLNDVMWAVCTRSDPAEDIEVLRKTWGSKADPLLVDHRRPYNNRAVIDACVPYERRSDFPPVAVADPAALAAARRRWGPVLGLPGA